MAAASPLGPEPTTTASSVMPFHACRRISSAHTAGEDAAQLTKRPPALLAPNVERFLDGAKIALGRRVALHDLRSPQRLHDVGRFVLDDLPHEAGAENLLGESGEKESVGRIGKRRGATRLR